MVMEIRVRAQHAHGDGDAAINRSITDQPGSSSSPVSPISPISPFPANSTNIRSPSPSFAPSLIRPSSPSDSSSSSSSFPFRLFSLLCLLLLFILVARCSLRIGWHVEDAGVQQSLWYGVWYGDSDGNDNTDAGRVSLAMQHTHGGPDVEYGLHMLPGMLFTRLWLMEDYVRRMWGPLPMFSFDEKLPVHATNQFEGQPLQLTPTPDRAHTKLRTLPHLQQQQQQQQQAQNSYLSSPAHAPTTVPSPRFAPLEAHLAPDRPFGVMYWLVFNADDRLNELGFTMRFNHKNWNGCTRYPVILWVETGMNDEERQRFHHRVFDIHRSIIDQEKDGRSEEEWRAAPSANLPCAKNQDPALWPPMPAHRCYPMYHCEAGNVELHAWYDEEGDESVRKHGRVHDAPLPWESELCHAVPLPEGVCLPWTVIIGEVEFDQRHVMPDPPAPSRAVVMARGVNRLKNGQILGVEPDGSEFSHECPPTRLPYRHMCRMQTFTQYHPLLAGFEYYMRLDDDGEMLGVMPYDPFTLMQKTGKDLGWVIAEQEWISCETQLSTHLRFYRDGLKRGAQLQQPPYTPPPAYQYGIGQRGYELDMEEEWNIERAIVRNEGNLSDPLHKAPVAPSSLVTGSDLWDDNVVYYFYNNFEVGRLSFWRDHRVRRFFQYIDTSHGTYRWRWGDAPIRSAAIQLFMPTDRIAYLTDIRYKHYTSFSYPEWTVEKKVWRFLHSLPFHNFVSFHVFSLILLPFLVLAAVLAAAIRLIQDCRQWKLKRAKAQGMSQSVSQSQSVSKDEKDGLAIEDEMPLDEDEMGVGVGGGADALGEGQQEGAAAGLLRANANGLSSPRSRSIRVMGIHDQLVCWVAWFRVFALVFMFIALSLDRLTHAVEGVEADLYWIPPRVIAAIQDLARWAWPAILLAAGVMAWNKDGQAKACDGNGEEDVDADISMDRDMKTGKETSMEAGAQRRTSRSTIVFSFALVLACILLFSMLSSRRPPELSRSELGQRMDEQPVCYLVVAVGFVTIVGKLLRRVPISIVHALTIVALITHRQIAYAVEASEPAHPHDAYIVSGHRATAIAASSLLGTRTFFASFFHPLLNTLVCTTCPFLVGWLMGFYITLVSKRTTDNSDSAYTYTRVRASDNEVSVRVDGEEEKEAEATNKQQQHQHGIETFSSDVDTDVDDNQHVVYDTARSSNVQPITVNNGPSARLRPFMTLPFCGIVLPIHRLPLFIHRPLCRLIALGDGVSLYMYRSIRCVLSALVHRYRLSILLVLSAVSMAVLIASQHRDFLRPISISHHHRDLDILKERKHILYPIVWSMMGIMAIAAHACTRLTMMVMMMSARAKAGAGAGAEVDSGSNGYGYGSGYGYRPSNILTALRQVINHYTSKDKHNQHQPAHLLDGIGRVVRSTRDRLIPGLSSVAAWSSRWYLLLCIYQTIVLQLLSTSSWRLMPASIAFPLFTLTSILIAAAALQLTITVIRKTANATLATCKRR